MSGETQHRNFIRLGNSNYEVRVRGKLAELLVDGIWVNHDDFMDRLFAANDYKAIADCVNGALILAPKEALKMVSSLSRSPRSQSSTTP
jgi:hypothetical protein